jgi:hypothetical protein
VAMSMRARGWWFAARAAVRAEEPEERLVEGLAAAWRAIESVPGETIDYHELVRDESLLREALRRLYPGAAVKRARFIHYVDFAAERDAIAARRGSDEYRRLVAFVAKLSW